MPWPATTANAHLRTFADTYKEKWPEVEAGIQLDGVLRDLASAMALANRKDDKTRKEFEKWAVLTFSNNQARINEKKGADGGIDGIDGIAYLLKDKGENGKAIFQVRSRPGTRADLATLNSDRLREKAEFGFLICTGPLDAPTKAMCEEILAAGEKRKAEEEDPHPSAAARLPPSPASGRGACVRVCRWRGWMRSWRRRRWAMRGGRRRWTCRGGGGGSAAPGERRKAEEEDPYPSAAARLPPSPASGRGACVRVCRWRGSMRSRRRRRWATRGGRRR